MADSLPSYSEELKEAVKAFKKIGSLPKIRGKDKARFIFVRNKNLAIEISRDREEIWVEFLRDETYTNFQDGIDAAITWLKMENK